MGNSLDEVIQDAEADELSIEKSDSDVYKHYIEILKEFINDEKRNKKTIIRFEDYVFLTRCNTLNEITRQKYSIPKIIKDGKNGHKILTKDGEIQYDYIAVNRVTMQYSWEIIENSVSIEGKMIDKIIQFFKPVSESIADAQQNTNLKIVKG